MGHLAFMVQEWQGRLAPDGKDTRTGATLFRCGPDCHGANIAGPFFLGDFNCHIDVFLLGIQE